MNRKVVSLLTVFLLIIFISLLIIFSQSTSGMLKAEAEALELVNLDYNVDKVNDFYWFTLEETYFSLDFTDTNGVRTYAIISQQGGYIEYLNSNDIISYQDAVSITINDNNPAKIIQPRLGIFNSVPVWEVSFFEEDDTLTYYIINATNGEWIQTIANI